MTTPINQMIDSVVKCNACGQFASANCRCFADADDMFRRLMDDLQDASTIQQMVHETEKILNEFKERIPKQ